MSTKLLIIKGNIIKMFKFKCNNYNKEMHCVRCTKMYICHIITCL